MQKKTFETPMLFADHHVTEVRRILLGVPGVQDVYASSAFRIVEVTYDETKVNDLEIAVHLDDAGYLGEWTAPVEIGATFVDTASDSHAQKAFFRHTQVFESTRQVGFSQDMRPSGAPIPGASASRALWPCPGMQRSRPQDE